MALLETMPGMPFGAVWEEFCRREDVPVEQEVVDIVLDYEADVQGLRV